MKRFSSKFIKNFLEVKEFCVSQEFFTKSYSIINKTTQITRDKIFFSKLEREQYENSEIKKEGISYIKIDIDIPKKGYYILSFDFNNSLIKIWINNTFLGIKNSKISRFKVYLNSGENEILIEGKNIVFSYNTKIYVFDEKYLKCDKNDYFEDIRKFYFEFINENGKINLICLTDDVSIVKERTILKLIIYKNDIDFFKRIFFDKILISFDVEYYKEITIDIKESLFNNIEFAYLGLTDEIEIDKIEPRKTFRKRFFLVEPKLAYENLISKYFENKGKFSHWERKFISNEIEKNFARFKNDYNLLIYLFIEILFCFFNQNKIKNFDDSIISSSYVRIIQFKSKLDLKPYKFGLFFPNKLKNEKNIKVILILSTNSCDTYIRYYMGSLNDEYVILEINVRGKNFGNYIGEFTIFEVIEYFKKHCCKKEIVEFYLIGYSSNASAVINIFCKYNNLFSGGLAIGGVPNPKLIGIINKINLICLTGEFDRNKKSMYYAIEESIVDNKKKCENFLLKGYDHNSISVFMRSKLFVSKMLNNTKENQESLRVIKNQEIKGDVDLKLSNIFLFPLRIFIKKAKYINIIKPFSSPKNLTYIQKNIVNFPIYISKIKHLFFKNCNRIFYNFRKKADDMVFKKNGFYYNSKNYEGKYSIMRIFKNKNNRLDLFINDNDEYVSLSNFFIKNIFIPSEINKKELPLSNYSIIFLNGKYFYIKERKGEIKKLFGEENV